MQMSFSQEDNRVLIFLYRNVSNEDCKFTPDYDDDYDDHFV